MITGELSTRPDLVEGLDADAIIDYLCHHGVLDTAALPNIDAKSSSPSERNRALLRQVESRGTAAVALFVNALRQSGQLHLASSLDTEPRIRPSTSGGYFGKGRHKGEVTVRIEVEWLKILAPPDPTRPDKSVDAALLNSSSGLGDGVVTDDDDDVVKPRCWCFCRRSKVKGRKKKEQHQAMSPVSSLDRGGETDKGGKGRAKKGKERSSKKKKSSSSKNEEQYTSARFSMIGEGDEAGQMRVETGKAGWRRERQPTNGLVEREGNNPPRGGRGGGIIMEYDPALELVKLRSGQAELGSPTRAQHGHEGQPAAQHGVLVEQWRAWGPHFHRKAGLLCARLGQMARDDLVRYFEQDRGTLVLDVTDDGAALCVVNICMMAAQVRRLQADVDLAQDGESPDRVENRGAASQEEDAHEENLGFLDRLQAILFAHVDIRDFDIRGIKLRLVLDKSQVDTALSELS